MHGLTRCVRFGCMRCRRCCACSPASTLAQAPGLGASVELVDPHAFRVCADPRNLPFSDEAGKGFENRLAELFATKLGEPTSYTYYPQVIGFVRNTLNALRCDVIMGVAVGDDLVQTTNPYYHTTYALVFRPGNGFDGIDVAGGSAAQGQAYRRRRRHAAGHRDGAAGADGIGQALPADGGYPRTKRRRNRWRTTWRPDGSMPACCGGRSPDTRRQRVEPHLAVVPLLKEQERDGLPHRHGRAAHRPGLEAQAQPADQREPAGDRSDSRRSTACRCWTSRASSWRREACGAAARRR